MIAFSDPPTGRELADAIHAAARAAGMTPNAFIKPLRSSDPTKWLRQLAEAKTPKPHTVDRVHALLAGEPVPPPPANNFQLYPHRPAVARVMPTPEKLPDPVDREPCFFCGIRADIGCRHNAGRLA